jgi:hypothetical protein
MIHSPDGGYKRTRGREVEEVEPAVAIATIMLKQAQQEIRRGEI